MSGTISLAAMTTGAFTLNASGTGAVNFSNTGTIAIAVGTKTITLRGTNTGNNILAEVIPDSTSKTSLTKMDKGYRC